MLAYTLKRTLTQKAIIETDKATEDKFGGEVTRERQVTAEVPCLLAPYVEASRGRAEQRATSVRTVSTQPALLIVERGVNVSTDRHWVKEVLDAKGSQLMGGPWRIVGVDVFEDHMELELERP
jgi:hypothetical protein